MNKNKDLSQKKTINDNIDAFLYFYLGKTAENIDLKNKNEKLWKIMYLKFIRHCNTIFEKELEFNERFLTFSKRIRNYLAHDLNYKSENEDKTNFDLLNNELNSFLEFWKSNEYFNNSDIDDYFIFVRKIYDEDKLDSYLKMNLCLILLAPMFLFKNEFKALLHDIKDLLVNKNLWIKFWKEQNQTSKKIIESNLINNYSEFEREIFAEVLNFGYQTLLPSLLRQTETDKLIEEFQVLTLFKNKIENNELEFENFINNLSMWELYLLFKSKWSIDFYNDNNNQNLYNKTEFFNSVNEEDYKKLKNKSSTVDKKTLFFTKINNNLISITFSIFNQKRNNRMQKIQDYFNKINENLEEEEYGYSSDKDTKNRDFFTLTFNKKQFFIIVMFFYENANIQYFSKKILNLYNKNIHSSNENDQLLIKNGKKPKYNRNLKNVTAFLSESAKLAFRWYLKSNRDLLAPNYKEKLNKNDLGQINKINVKKTYNEYFYRVFKNYKSEKSAIKSIKDSLNHFFIYNFTQDFRNFKSLNELHDFYQSKLSNWKKDRKNYIQEKIPFYKMHTKLYHHFCNNKDLEDFTNNFKISQLNFTDILKNIKKTILNKLSNCSDWKYDNNYIEINYEGKNQITLKVVLKNEKKKNYVGIVHLSKLLYKFFSENNKNPEISNQFEIEYKDIKINNIYKMVIKNNIAKLKPINNINDKLDKIKNVKEEKINNPSRNNLIHNRIEFQ